MPNFRYKALTQAGELVSGSVFAPNSAEVTSRIEYLGLIPIDQVAEQGAAAGRLRDVGFFSRPRPEDVTVFTADLALLLKAGARINDALEMFASDADIGRLRPTATKITAALLAGESFADALAGHPDLFPPIYLALVRVGEAAGSLEHVLEVLGAERARAEGLRRRLVDALQYPVFLLVAACVVLIFFLTFVLPQFASVLRDFNAKLDPVMVSFFAASDFMRSNFQALAAAGIILVAGGWYALRQRRARRLMMDAMSRLPFIRSVVSFHRAALFCRNLGLLLETGVALTTSLRILSEMMSTAGQSHAWEKVLERVRHGAKLSDALAGERALPTLAVRTFRLGEELGELPMLAARIGDFYGTKLQRSLDRIVGVVGPLAIIVISLVIGGLIVSVMTALLSVNQMVG